MAVTSGFFDSIDGDRVYTAEQMTTYFKGLVSDGVYQTVDDAMTVRATGEGLNITVGTGRALCRTHWINVDEPVALSLSPASTANARIDLVVIRYDATTRAVSIEVVEGTPSATPTAPERQHTDLVWELILAKILVDKNASLLTQSKITDLRPSSECGWVTGLITQVDTANLFLQFQNAYSQQLQIFENYLTQKQAEFDTFFSHLTQKLSVDTTIHKYQNVVRTVGNTMTLNIGIPEFDPKSDILFVFIDGIKYIERLPDGDEYTEGDYIVSGSGTTAKITFNGWISGTHKVEFLVLKSLIGEPGGTNIPPASVSLLGTGIVGMIWNAEQEG